MSKLKSPKPVTFFVSPKGNDAWSGLLARPTPTRKDGPFATLEKVRRAARAHAGKTPVRIYLRGGFYQLPRPIRFDEKDSGTKQHPVCYQAYRRERPVLSGGEQIQGWCESTVDGKRIWKAVLPDVKTGDWNFTQLWVNGRRAVRPRLPKKGLWQIESIPARKPKAKDPLFEGQDRFTAKAGDLDRWSNIQNVEFIALHYWIESRIPFRAVNPATGEARLRWKSRMCLKNDFVDQCAYYYVENIFEALSEAGEWYLDRPSGTLYYLPLPDEKLSSSEVIAPRLPQLLLIEGNYAKNKPVEHLHFKGIEFSHTEWTPGPEAQKVIPQAACHIPGALVMQYARNCSITECGISHLGSYGLEISKSSSQILIGGNRILDLAGGGIKIWHRDSDFREPSLPNALLESCHEINVRDNEIAEGGKRWRQAVGVLVGKCSGISILHNHVHHFDYTGISVGWEWGYGQSNAYGNVIEFNHIHHIGQGTLSDMGGIYMLGVSPGTRIRYNRIHDVVSRGYGGWGIYLDEGSTHILVEHNLVYRNKSGGFNQHYGKNNMVRNNIFAFGGELQFRRTRFDGAPSFHLINNIFLSDNGGKMLAGDWKELGAVIQGNLYFDLKTKKNIRFLERSFKAWQDFGADVDGTVADPLFVNPKEDDFTLPPDSPAIQMGFVPFVDRAGARFPFDRHCCGE